MKQCRFATKQGRSTCVMISCSLRPRGCWRTSYGWTRARDGSELVGHLVEVTKGVQDRNEVKNSCVVRYSYTLKLKGVFVMPDLSAFSAAYLLSYLSQPYPLQCVEFDSCQWIHHMRFCDHMYINWNISNNL